MEDGKIIAVFICGMLFESFNDFLVEPVRKRWRRKCNYDCSKCGVWDCDRHLCNEQKEKDIKKGKLNI